MSFSRGRMSDGVGFFLALSSSSLRNCKLIEVSWRKWLLSLILHLSSEPQPYLECPMAVGREEDKQVLLTGDL